MNIRQKKRKKKKFLETGTVFPPKVFCNDIFLSILSTLAMRMLHFAY